MEKIFYEEQKFNSKWFWPVLGILIPCIVLFFDPAIDFNGAFLFLLKNFGLNMLVYLILRRAKLVTLIDKNGIRVAWQFSCYFLFEKSIHWTDILEGKIIDYSFIKRGYGTCIKYGTILNVQGSRGLFLKLKKGHNLLIRTQEETHLLQFLNRIKTYSW